LHIDTIKLGLFQQYPGFVLVALEAPEERQLK
jgi:hypothetical protein